MDTSETYIKMCDCKEIQGSQPRFLREDKEFRHIGDNGEYIWLPRQDQLQEMVGKGDMSLLIHRFFGFVSGLRERGYSWKVLGTMEQLWLRFLMVDKYNKVWDGEGW